MFVHDCMTHDPITVRPDSDPLAGVALLKACGFRHLPVVETDGSLVGIVSRTDLESFLAEAESPGILKRQHRVDQAMTREAVTVPPDCPLEEAAGRMMDEKISSLPVVQEGKVVGIVTETDIFRQLAAMLGRGSDSLRLTVQVPHVPGQFARLAGCIAETQGNITSFVAHTAGEPGRINATVRVEGADRQRLLDALASLPQVHVLHDWEAELA